MTAVGMLPTKITGKADIIDPREEVAMTEQTNLLPISLPERVVAIEAILPHLATKADLADLKVDFAKAESSMKGWFVLTMLAFLAVIVPMLLYIISQLP